MKKVNRLIHLFIIILFLSILSKYIYNFFVDAKLIIYSKQFVYMITTLFLLISYLLITKNNYFKQNLHYILFISIFFAYSIELIFYYQDYPKKNNYYTAEESVFYHNDDSQPFPLGLKSNQKYLYPYCEEKNYFITDKFGYINSNNDYDKKNFDIILLGPTLAHSECGIKQYNFSEIFRKDNFSVLSFNTLGTSILSSYANYIEHAKKYNSKKLILFLYEQHLHDLLQEMESKQLVKYLFNDKYTQNLFLRQDEVDSFISHYNNSNLTENTKKYTFASFLKLNFIRKNSIDEIIRILHKRHLIIDNYDVLSYQADVSFYDYFDQIIGLFKSNKNKNQKFITVYIPSRSNYSGNFKSVFFDTYSVKKILSDNSLLIDLSKNINHKNFKSFYIKNNHLSYSGQLQILEIIKKKL